MSGPGTSLHLVVPKQCTNSLFSITLQLTAPKAGTRSLQSFWTGVHGNQRTNAEKEALTMFGKSHVAPSYRRLPHGMWVSTMSLVLDLLVGRGKRRYVETPHWSPKEVSIHVQGFSAGSYSGLCLLHLLWKLEHVHASGKLGGIAVPPLLLHTIPEGKKKCLHLIHFPA